MKISAVTLHNYYKTTTKHKTTPFKGQPIKISETRLNASDFSKYLAKASYWDVHDDAFQKNYIDIRKNNLDKIDTLSSYEKKKFIYQYCSATGFPSLKNVSENIENEFITSANACSLELNHATNSDCYTITQLGYDSTCSVGKRYALPGSDIDRGYIILKGCDNKKKNKEIVNEYSSKLWDYTDQRLLSFNHYKSFPIIKTEKQVKDDFTYYDRIYAPNNLTAFKNEKSTYRDNYFIGVNSFLVGLKEQVPIQKKDNLITNAYLAEVLREGKVLINNPKRTDFFDEIEDTLIYKFSNITQLSGIKDRQGELDQKYKTKYSERQELCNNFDNFDTEKKLQIIKDMISSSCEIPNNKGKLFENTQNIAGHVEQLLSELLFDDKNLSVTPKIKSIDGGYEISGGASKENNARLYLSNYGNDETTIFAEFESLPMINYVIINKPFIKNIKMFENAEKIQFYAPKDFDEEGFHLVKYEENSNYSVFGCDF